MMKNALRNRYLLVLLLLVFGYIFIQTPMIGAQQHTHMVKKGDTLWSICEKYYGDPDLWPKLWQMNPFITNPHVLTPGDLITLFEKETTVIPKKQEKILAKETVKPIPRVKGIDVTSLTNINTIGYLSFEKIIPWGKIFSSDSDRLIFYEGETVYVLFNDSKKVQPGDEFVIYETHSIKKYPFPGNVLAYTIAIKGRLAIQKRTGIGINEYGVRKAKKNTYQAKIVQIFGTISKDDDIMPYESVSSCVRPISLDQEVSGNIVASRDERQLISRNSVVYIDRGFNQGIDRGNLFEVFKTHVISDPENKSQLLIRKMELPNIKIGVIMILESRPDSATALVISAKEDIPIGAFIKEMSWEEKEKPEFLSLLPSCNIE